MTSNYQYPTADLLGRSQLQKVFITLIAFIVLSIFSGCAERESLTSSQSANLSADSQESFVKFEAHLETIRQALKIPGMSAAVVRDQELVWASGFGYADIENQIAALPDTPYGLASVTKPVAAVLVMQLVEQGLIDLDTPVKHYGVNAGNDGVTVRHLLTHTSEGELGTSFYYNGDRYALLGGVIEGATGNTFAKQLSKRVLVPLGMKSTALNPINDWYRPSSSGIEDFARTIGLSDGFQNYPGVYSRLAQPYQFDQDYNLIPGKYHLHHNPAAGMISSVTDLARFDIALEQGLLLADSTKAEMWSPAFSTYQDRPDLMYGLGWYTQKFDGLDLYWHTGRWAPSTSALYLKVPEADLTFIVLANTDNLTVPFYGVGVGDISKSALALSFFRHIVYPQVNGISLPEIDWSATEGTLVNQINEVNDPEVRLLLERELWSFRQVHASVGHTDQVYKLTRVNARAFPGSKYRSDELFTNLPGKYPVIPPVIPAASFVWLSRITAAWFILVVISLLAVLFRLRKDEHTSRYGKVIWLVGTIFLGPFAILYHVLSHPRPGRGGPENWQRALRASVLTITGYTLGWVLAMAILRYSGSDPHPLLILGVSYLIPLLMSLLLFRFPLQIQMEKSRARKVFSRILLAEVINVNLVYGVFFSLTMLASEKVLTTIPQISSPFFWDMLSFIACVGVAAVFPLQYWMVRQSYRLPSSTSTDITEGAPLPTLRASWPALLSTFLIMFAALVVTITLLA
jgi:CubicO group peptidase (beta-lactamase class C family)